MHDKDTIILGDEPFSSVVGLTPVIAYNRTNTEARAGVTAPNLVMEYVLSMCEVWVQSQQWGKK